MGAERRGFSSPPSCSGTAPTLGIPGCLSVCGQVGWGGSPDAQCGLDEGGDAHTGEDGANELADHVLVTAHTQRLRQEEGHSDGAAEAGQVMLGAGWGEGMRQGPGCPGKQGHPPRKPPRLPQWPKPVPTQDWCSHQGSHRETAHLSGVTNLPLSYSCSFCGVALFPVAGTPPGRRCIVPGVQTCCRLT